MHILLSNDDGVLAPGLVALATALRSIAKVTVMAPESERSGYSSALTLDRPLRPIQLDNGFWAVNGTPADCVYLALNGFFASDEADFVVSGINSSANLGDDVIYSGTVGAALEGRFLGKPAPSKRANDRHFALLRVRVWPPRRGFPSLFFGR